MKKVVLLLVVLLGIFGCTGKNVSSGTKVKKVVKEAPVKPIKVGLLVEGLGDKGFNDSAFIGLKQAEKKLGIKFNYVEPASEEAVDYFLKKYAESDYDLIVVVGYRMKAATEKAAIDHPNAKFAIVDARIDLPNVASLLFKEDEGSFLVGALSGMMTRTGVIGFIGGIDIPLIRKFQEGYSSGAKYVNQNVMTVDTYIGGANPFYSPGTGRRKAEDMIKKGADILYSAAGRTGLGVIDAAKDAGIYAIGVDSDQDGLAPGTVLTSMVKHVDVAVYNTVKITAQGNFKPGINLFGLKEGGVGITDLTYTKDKIPTYMLAKLKKIEIGIIDGSIDIHAR
ncbi:BMP family lipoprotein [Haliovirga abyssi]|uniref:BMP family ABC transporter substrate-binding protein n=1 Tax=Haliovirga abyssi TaxID=2996794 RepID=A0AAU9D2Z4_9FUSO|nr:BMP family ABC transporter substrate-binding protein [Haliovirga abyssi]BDU50374.1 BMP family ABC transporter substrate-binding protein [Haliovirga abyssi]